MHLNESPMIKTKTSQAGGTLLGLIIGLLIGLSVAVVVAVVITKTPVPFLSKPAQADKNAPLAPGQMTDPNKPMYGNKEAARAAARDFEKDAANKSEHGGVDPKAA